MTLRNTLLALFYFLFFSTMAFAQPANDECANAYNILTPANICMNFSSVGATVSTFSKAQCFNNSGKDVWFMFKAVGIQAKLDIVGIKTGNDAALNGIEAVFYSGDCSQFNELPCKSTSSGALELVASGLILAQTYYIRVQGFNNTTGGFKLCLKNFNPPTSFDADCIVGPTLCDKSSFAVPNLNGPGKDATDLNDADCLSGGGQNAESNSTWFRFTCDSSGPLTFTLTPFYDGDGTKNNLGDDIDFAVYELPNGISSCTSKKLLRCEAGGPYIQTGPLGDSTTTYKQALRCKGTTGLRMGETNIIEPGGCDGSFNHTNFLKPVDMIAGHSYAIGINSFQPKSTAAQSGIYVEFGQSFGSGTFVGPKAKIAYSVPSKSICVGENITYTDSSSFTNGQIVDWQWSFGKDASVAKASGKAPKTVYYKTPGWKSVVLTVTTARNCAISTILDSVYVKGFQYDSTVRKPTCTLGNDGLIRLKVIACGKAPIKYNWENTGYTTRDSLSGIGRGTYRVAVTDSSGIYVDTLVFKLQELTLSLDTAVNAIQNPSCKGLTNGKITLSPSTGTRPYVFNYGKNNTLDSTLAGLGEGTYTVKVVDANNCKGNFILDLVNPPKVQLDIDTFNISCYGKTDGASVAHPSGGVGNYSVSWSTGTIGDTVRNLSVGTYNVFVNDGNKCEARQSFTIAEPPQLLLDTLRIKPAKCFGDSTAELVVKGRGGTPPFKYSIDGYQYSNDSSFLKIPAKNYKVYVRDSTGCQSTFAVNVPQPNQLQVSAGADQTIELGFSTTIAAIVVPSKNPVKYAWTPADTTLQCATCAVATVTPYHTTDYTITVRDSQNCVAFDVVEIRVSKNRPIYIPNSFSPNGDGVNDYFTVYGNPAAVIIKEFKVFNRWGNLIWETNDMPLGVDQKGWDGFFGGKLLSPDVYAFYVKVLFLDGEEVIYRGDITLIR